jgi:hypothetical protein
MTKERGWLRKDVSKGKGYGEESDWRRKVTGRGKEFHGSIGLHSKLMLGIVYSDF